MLSRISATIDHLRADDMARHGLLMVFFGVVAGLLNYLYQLSMGILLAPEEYGALFSLISLSMIIAMFTQTFQTSASRFTSTAKIGGSLGKVKCLWKYFLVRALLLGLGLFFLVSVLAPVIGRFLGLDDSLYVVVLSASLILSFALPVNQGFLQGLQRFVPLGLCQALLALIKVGLGVLLVYVGLGVSGGLLPLVITSVIVFIVSVWFLRDVVASKDEECAATGILSYTGMAFIAICSFAILTNVDVILAKHYLSSEEAGSYSALSVLGRMALYAPMGIGIAMFPKTSEMFDSGADYHGTMRKALLYTILLGGLVIATYCLLFGFIVDFVFGGKYDFMLADTVKYGLAMLLFSISFLLMNYLLSLNRKWVGLAFLVAVGVQIGLVIAFHSTITQIVNVMLVSGAVCLVGILVLRMGDRRRYP